jgi:hypothetical protein
MVCPSCTHRETSVSFAASAVETQQPVEKLLRASSAPGSGAKNGVRVVFSPRFRTLSDCPPGRRPLFQQAGKLKIP